MRIISLECRHCGAPLQINQGVKQLACAHCGAQMSVEREGGTISLKLLEALGSIRTGAVQTAAELALVRLGKEFNDVSSQVLLLELEAKSCEATFNPNDLLSQSALGSAETRAAAIRTRSSILETEIKERTATQESLWGFGPLISIFCGMVGCHVARGFGDSLISFVALLILGLILTTLCTLFNSTGSLTEELEKLVEELTKLEGESRAHQIALGKQTRLSQIQPQLVKTRAELAWIREEINRNKTIVSSR